MGGPKKTAEFARLYLAPGVSHCEGGPGPQPTGVFDALVRWVEDGKAPGTLLATRHDQTTGDPTVSGLVCSDPGAADLAVHGTAPSRSCTGPVADIVQCDPSDRNILWINRSNDLTGDKSCKLFILLILQIWLGALDDVRNGLLIHQAA